MILSIIIPVYNEEKTIIQILEKIKKVSSNLVKYEVVVINDGSTDQTNSLLDKNKHLYDKLIIGVQGHIINNHHFRDMSFYNTFLPGEYRATVLFDKFGDYIWKQLEKDYKNEINMDYIPEKNHSKFILEKYNIKNIPALIFIPLKDLDKGGPIYHFKEKKTKKNIENFIKKSIKKKPQKKSKKKSIKKSLKKRGKKSLKRKN